MNRTRLQWLIGFVLLCWVWQLRSGLIFPSFNRRMYLPPSPGRLENIDAALNAGATLELYPLPESCQIPLKRIQPVWARLLLLESQVSVRHLPNCRKQRRHCKTPPTPPLLFLIYLFY